MSSLTEDTNSAEWRSPNEEEQKDRDRRVIFVDLIMLVLIIVNLSWLVFDWFFDNHTFQEVLHSILPTFTDWYKAEIHNDFIKIDFWFVTVFIIEILIRWALAIYRKTYPKWFFYPFVYWYDVLGVIPISSFRILRLLRIYSIGYRLHRLGIIDMTKTYAYKVFSKYRDIFTEEVSDRVVANVITSIQEEVELDNPLADRIKTEVIAPKKDVLVDYISHRVKRATASNYDSYKEDIRLHIDKLVEEGVEKTAEIKDLEKIPIVGKQISLQIERATANMVFNTVDISVRDLMTNPNNRVVEEITAIIIEAVLEEDIESETEMREVTKETILHLLEVVKEQVMVKKWQLKEQAEKQQKNV